LSLFAFRFQFLEKNKHLINNIWFCWFN